MKRLLFSLLILIPILANAQKLKWHSGVSINNYYTKENYGHFRADNSPFVGLITGIALEDFKRKTTPEIIANIEFYSGRINAYDGGQAGGYSTDAAVRKALFSLYVFPINIRIHRKGKFSLGACGSQLLLRDVNGIKYSWRLGQSSTSKPFKDEENTFVRRQSLGLVGKVGYKLHFKKKYIVEPLYTYQYNFTPEFREFPTSMKITRHMLSFTFSKF